jgi:hypothetical protein
MASIFTGVHRPPENRVTVGAEARWNHWNSGSPGRNKIIDGEPLATTEKGPIVCRERLGGLLNFYFRNVDPQERIQ